MSSRRSQDGSGSLGFALISPRPDWEWERGGREGEEGRVQRKDSAAAQGFWGKGNTDQLLLMGGILYGGVDVQGSGLELGVLLGTGAQQTEQQQGGAQEGQQPQAGALHGAETASLGHLGRPPFIESPRLGEGKKEGARKEGGVEEGPGQPSVGSAPPPLDVNARRAPGAQERGSAHNWMRAQRPGPRAPKSCQPATRDFPLGA